MQALRIVMLLVTVALCYLLFVYSPTKSENEAAGLTPPGSSPTTAHSEYKEAMDRAHAAAKAIQDERKEADAN